MLRQKKSPELKKLVLILQAWFVLLSMQKGHRAFGSYRSAATRPISPYSET